MNAFTSRLRPAWAWLTEARHLWGATAIIVVALFLSLRAGATEQVIRLTGLVLQLLGIASVDQPELQPNGRPTQNGLFHMAAQEAKNGRRPAERVRVYEKLRQGIWSYNGLFELVDSWRESDGKRLVFRFRLLAIEDVALDSASEVQPPARRRIIPSHVKVEVWKRDGGRCVICGATDELHFDHDVPFSKGGASITAANVQLLCARHNLEKKDSIA